MKWLKFALFCGVFFLPCGVNAQGSAGGTNVASYGSTGGTYVHRHVHRPQLHLFHRERSEGSSGGYSYGSAGGTFTEVYRVRRSYGSSGGYATEQTLCPNCRARLLNGVLAKKCDCNCRDCTGGPDCNCSCNSCSCKSQPATKPEPPKDAVKK